ncbi:nickel pincer cofactor biosynthesis protein LarB [Ignisphaera sp. 4213-co]|uniref:Nickel pincer cofactor biosynthesis protein LarB n=1 Tax=Ignisphaera cupida TaxID=3050454 RepID=A0ABD4Z820_9CREN|nr:nickel pincer cofactor biosynthesis protein LarB [Ignisphaera sp. 4213-co]MDK6029384.1 nickel pincer cofactor biosynthesis protein LarB [Ignisphaera sp. 4213-co]
MDLRKVLEDLASGKISVEEALRRIRLFSIEYIENVIRFDVGRELRRDVPEIVFGEGKSVENLEKILVSVVPRSGRVIVSRLTNEQIAYLENAKFEDFEIFINKRGRIAVVKKKDFDIPKYDCRVGVVAAGTADIGVAEEAKVVVEQMGCETVSIYDVGVAGFHRVLEALKILKERDVDVAIVVAGMEGALPSVVASLIDVPVIGVPTSVGYGAGGEGLAALYSMLQACPLGLAVVNIDNGVNAGVVAGLIGRRISLYKQKCVSVERT